MFVGFRQRWGFAVLVIMTFLIVFFSFNPGKSHCHCKLKCPALTPPCHCVSTAAPPSVTSQDNLIGGRLQAIQTQHLARQEIRKEGWILDCVTWNKKWESNGLDADPHDLSWDEEKMKPGENPEQRLKVFTEIFQKRHWPSHDPSYPGVQASGPGAMLKNAQSAMAALHVIITKVKAYLGKETISILDVSCGDMQWMNKFLITRDDVEYTGIDIVPELINSAKRQFSSLPKSEFLTHDIVSTPLNNSYDIIVCRDTLIYLHQSDALKALYHMSSSGSKFLLSTSFPDTTQNGELSKTGPLSDRKFPYNLELPPFLLEPPVCTSYDWNVEHLALWQLPVRQKYEY